MIWRQARKRLVGVALLALPCLHAKMSPHSLQSSHLCIWSDWSAVCTFIVLLWQGGGDCWCWRKTIKDILNILVNIPVNIFLKWLPVMMLPVWPCPACWQADTDLQKRPTIILFFFSISRTPPVLLLSSSFPVKITPHS